MIFLTGFIIERLKDEEMAHKGYYGFEIMHQDLSGPAHPSGSSAGHAEHHRLGQRLKPGTVSGWVGLVLTSLSLT